MKNDTKMLCEIYTQIYYTHNNVLITEGFFNKLAHVLAPILMTGIVAGSISNVAPTRQPHAAQAAATQDGANAFGNVFSNDQRALNFLNNKQEFEITPRQFMVSRYGNNWYKTLANARQQQRNNTDVNYWMNLSDQALDTTITVFVYKTTKEYMDNVLEASPTQSGSRMDNYIFLKLEDADHLGGIANILEHEIRHTLQPTSAWKSSNDPSRWQTTSTAFNADRYVGNTAETGVRLAQLVQQYYKDTGKLIINAQDADNALRMYGFIDADQQTIDNIKIMPDVLKLRNLYHRLAPDAKKDLYKKLTNQMPGLVQQVYQQTHNTTS